MASPSVRPFNRDGVLALSGLVIGLGLGVLGRAGHLPPILPDAARWLVRAWTDALTIVVVPLVVAQLFLAVAGPAVSGSSLRRYGLYVPVVFAGLLLLGVTLSVTLTMGALRMPLVRSLSATVDGAALEEPAEPAATEAPAAARPVRMLLSRLVVSARSGDLLTLMVLALVAGLASRRGPGGVRQALSAAATGLSRVSVTVTRWLVLASPAALVGVGLIAMLATGWQVGPVLLAFTLLTILLAVAASLALYVLAMAAGVPVAPFARAAAPGQMVAAASRSSLASVPVLVSGAERELALPGHLSATVIGFAGATLKLARAVSTPAMLLFIVHVFGLTLTLPQLVTFLVTILVISPVSPGVPKMVSGTQAMPAFVAAGISPAYVALLGSTTVLADVFETVLNTTGYLTAAVLVGRLDRHRNALDRA